jgi:superfamily II DNA/RNA helicase
MRKADMLILDEADTLLEMGFSNDLNFIIDHLPKERQTFLFSATVSKEIAAIAKIGLSHGVRDVGLAEQITQSTGSSDDNVFSSSSPVTQLQASGHSADKQTDLHVLVPGADLERFVGDLSRINTLNRLKKMPDEDGHIPDRAQQGQNLRRLARHNVGALIISPTRELATSRVDGGNEERLGS